MANIYECKNALTYTPSMLYRLQPITRNYVSCTFCYLAHISQAKSRCYDSYKLMRSLFELFSDDEDHILFIVTFYNHHLQLQIMK